MIEREIGLLQKIVGMHAVFRRQRDTDTGADADVVFADREGLGDERDDLGAQAPRRRRSAGESSNWMMANSSPPSRASTSVS